MNEWHHESHKSYLRFQVAKMTSSAKKILSILFEIPEKCLDSNNTEIKSIAFLAVMI